MPAGQSPNTLEPWAAVNWPFAHCVHVLAFSPAQWPGVHVSQSDFSSAPEWALAVPASQLTHVAERSSDHSPKPHERQKPSALAPSAGWRLPAAHLAHVSEPKSSEYSPDWHTAHSAWPLSGFAKPLAHGVHAPIDALPLAPFSVPAAQAVHAEAPLPEKWTLLQSVQWVMLGAPVLGDSVPASHWVQATEPPADQEPAGQDGHAPMPSQLEKPPFWHGAHEGPLRWPQQCTCAAPLTLGTRYSASWSVHARKPSRAPQTSAAVPLAAPTKATTSTVRTGVMRLAWTVCALSALLPMLSCCTKPLQQLVAHVAEIGRAHV